MNESRYIPFSERVGAVRSFVQIDSMDEHLSNDIYNYIWLNYFLGIPNEVTEWDEISIQSQNFQILWIKFLNHPITDLEFALEVSDLENLYSRFKWYRKYDLVEFCLNKLKKLDDNKDIIPSLNNILLQNNSGYRCINNKLVAISGETEIKSISKAIESTLDEGHIKTALDQLSAKKAVNYNVVASESIAAVESALGNIVKEKFPNKYQHKNTLGSLIKVLKSEELIPNHPAFSEAWLKMYGYLSDSGIRHGNAQGETHQVKMNEAIYILSTCSAFVNYLQSLYVVY